MRVEYVEIEKLIPYARNSRTHSEEQVSQVAASIKEFGFTNPVLIDADGGIIAGHGRTMAARKLGMTDVPCIRLGHLTEAQKRAYVIADNKLALNAGWDEKMLALEFADLRALEFDTTLTGFSLDDIDELLAELDATPEGETDANAAPPVPTIARTHPGDLWLLGKHRLMCGDSTNAAAVDALMDGGKADLIVTDPPYGVDFSSRMEDQHEAAKINPRHKRTTHEAGIPNDNLKGKNLSDFFFAAFAAMNSAMRPGCAFYLFAPQGGEQMMMMMMMQKAGLPVRHELIWVKNNHVLGRADYHYKHEPILYGWKEGAAHQWYGDRSRMSVWEVNRATKSLLHPTMKPIELIEIPLQNSSRAGDIVLDLFGGSGSTLIACEITGRKNCSMELDPKYCDVIVRRWQQFTGKRAMHAVTGQEFGE